MDATETSSRAPTDINVRNRKMAPPITGRTHSKTTRDNPIKSYLLAWRVRKIPEEP